MATCKYISRICAAGTALTLLLTALLWGVAPIVQAASRTMGYEGRLFDTSRVHTVDIVMDGWEAFLEGCENEEYAACTAVIDGEAYRNIGIRAKGNTSLRTVSSLGSDRYSFKLEFDQYDSGKSYYGLDKLCLNNIIQDNTYMKDYLAYQMMGGFGVAAPLCSYAYITVNGEDWGLYLAVEGVEEGFLQRNYGSQYGALYKPDSMDLGGGRGNGQDFAAPGGMGSASDVKLQYIDGDPDSYPNLFGSAKTDVAQADRERLIQSLQKLSQCEDLEDVLDVDMLLRYFVVHNFVVNGDSYTGSMVHNYYLYEEGGRLSLIPWDYNLAFGTFQAGDASGAVNDPIDAPLSVTGSGDRPMIDWIFSSGEYTQQYHQYFAQFLETADWEGIIAQAQALISPYVEKDPTKFCTYEEFEAGARALAVFCRLRAQSVAGQLAGDASPVDASGLALSDMGSMEAGGGAVGAFAGGGFPGGGQGPAGEGGMDRQQPPGEGGLPGEAPGEAPRPGQDGGASGSPLPLLGGSAAVLLAGLLAAFKFKRGGI